VCAAGRYIETHYDAETNTNINDTTFYNKPFIYNTGNEKSTTGYDICKWLVGNYSLEHYTSRDYGGEQRTQYNCTTAVPILRAAECYLNYLEAYFMRYGSLGGNCERYWKALRQRAGVDDDFNKTINNTDLEKENDLAVWSRGQLIDKTLYNIRRERRCEFIAEGMRFDDLKRWRSLDMMKDYQPEGFRLWGTLNEQLADTNGRLIATNKRRESLAKVYIDLCATYIHRLERFQLLVQRKIKAKQTTDLLSAISSQRLSAEENAAFMHRFDKTFLELYPTFVNEFNALLLEGEQITLPHSSTLTTELRIFALIRLGVKESSEIAALLQFAPRTVYNYRSAFKTRVRDREHFEEQVCKLCTEN
jgi:hypothetical protein